RALPVTPKQIEHFLGRTIGRAAVAGRHDAAGAVAALGIGDDATAQVVLGLALVEPGVVALGVGVPHIHCGAGDRRAIHIEHLTVEEHHRGDAVFAAVVHARLALGYWRTGHVERAFDGARRTAHQAIL